MLLSSPPYAAEGAATCTKSCTWTQTSHVLLRGQRVGGGNDARVASATTTVRGGLNRVVTRLYLARKHEHGRGKIKAWEAHICSGSALGSSGTWSGWPAAGPLLALERAPSTTDAWTSVHSALKSWESKRLWRAGSPRVDLDSPADSVRCMGDDILPGSDADLVLKTIRSFWSKFKLCHGVPLNRSS